VINSSSQQIAANLQEAETPSAKPQEAKGGGSWPKMGMRPTTIGISWEYSEKYPPVINHGLLKSPTQWAAEVGVYGRQR
jgi:hypothetical protein